MNICLSFLHDLAFHLCLMMMACICNVSVSPFMIIFNRYMDVSTRPTKCTDDGSISGISILRV